MYFFENMTYKEIGKKYSVHQEVIRQNINKAVRILRGDILRNGSYPINCDSDRERKNKSEEMIPVLVSVNPSLVHGAMQIRHISVNDIPTDGSPIKKSALKHIHSTRLVDFDKIYTKSANTTKKPIIDDDSNEPQHERYAREAFQFYEDYLNYLKTLIS